MFCEQCGTKIGENERLCAKCEEKLFVEVPLKDIVSINGVPLQQRGMKLFGKKEK